MQNFTYYAPTEVVFGRDTENQTGALVKKYGGTRVLVLYGGGSAVKSGLLGRVQASLEATGITSETIGGVRPNPVLSFARETLEKARAFGADFLLAVGGGSVIDTAKAIAIGLAHPGVDLWDFWTGKAVPTACIPVGTVMTIPAAGSEMSNSSVLTDEETNAKRGMNHDLIRPKFAVMNPALCVTLPKYQLTCGIVDIMMHTMDRYFNPMEGNQLTDEISEGLLRVTIRNGKVANQKPDDYDALSELMWCGSLSHNNLTGLGCKNDFAPHQLAHELSGKFDAAHGAALSTVWGAWAEYVYQTKPERFAQFAKNVWGIENPDVDAAARAGIQANVEFFRSLEMPTCLSELGVPVQNETELRELADRCMYGGKRKVGTFRVLAAEDAYQIYRAINH